MFFAIAALVVSAIEITVGVCIGLSVAKYRRSQSLRAPTSVDSLPVSADMFGEDFKPKPAAAAVDFAAAVRLATTAGAHEPAQSAEPDCGPRTANHPASRTGTPGSAAETAPAVALPPGAERRTSTRRPFSFRQHVAPYHGGILPGKASFREVECQDISSTGFSFLSTQLPDFDSLVVALGVPPRLTYLQAQIVNRLPVDDSKAPLYRIGCRFSGQVMPW